MTKDIEDILIRFDLPFVIKEPTQGDGNCFFRAVVNQIQRNDVIIDIPSQMISSHILLRNAVVDFVSYNYELNTSEEFQIAKIDYCQKYQLAGEPIERTWERKLADMRKNGTWAEDLFVVCTAMFLKNDILITSNSQTKENPWNIIEGKKSNIFSSPLTLAYIENQHFRSLHPHERKSKSDKSKIYNSKKRCMVRKQQNDYYKRKIK